MRADPAPRKPLGIVGNFIAGVTIPSIRSGLATDLSGARLVVSAYTPSYGVLLVPAGSTGAPS